MTSCCLLDRRLAAVSAALLVVCFYSQPAAACGVPLSVSDIQHGIMPTEDNLPCRSSSPVYQGNNDQAAREQAIRDQAARDRAAQEAARRRAAYEAQCDENFRQANQAFQQAQKAEADDPGGAVTQYERSLSLYSKCGPGGDVTPIMQGLQRARAVYAATKDDNRVSDAQSRFGASTYEKGDRPFATPKNNNEAVGNAAASPKINPNDLTATATQKCGATADGSSERKSCMTSQEARLIMNADDGIRAACGMQYDVTSRDDCALQMYASQVAYQQAYSGPEKNCYFEQNGKPCYPGGVSSPDAKAATPSLREQLRAKLVAAMKAAGVDSGAAGNKDQVAPVSNQQGQTEAAQPTVTSSDNDPMKNYLNSTDASSLGRNNGDLGPPK